MSFPIVYTQKKYRFFTVREFLRVFFAGLTFLYMNPAFSILNYGLTVTTPGYTYLVGGTAIPNFNWGCADGMVSSLLPIGFTFVYDGVSYTQFEVSDNGELFLGGSYTCSDNCGTTCNFSEKQPAGLSGGTDRPAICPLWDDLAFNSSTSKLSYLTTGTAGNHILTIEWLLMDWKYNNPNIPHGTISFQVVLYEAISGQIDFIYKQEAQALGTGIYAPTARIGLMGGTSGDYYSTDAIGSAPSKTSETTVTSKPATGILLRWNDNSGLPIELLYLKGIALGNHTVRLNWETVTETSNDYFTLYKSTDANNFKPIGKIKGAGNSLATHSYIFIDSFVPDSFNIFYYYLKQTDFNGKSSSSDNISVTVVKGKPPNIYFNEDTKQVTISYNFNRQEDYYQVEIIDMLGSTVYQKKIEPADYAENVFTIPLLFSHEGIYIAILSNAGGNTLSQTKFLKQ